MIQFKMDQSNTQTTSVQIVLWGIDPIQATFPVGYSTPEIFDMGFKRVGVLVYDHYSHWHMIACDNYYMLSHTSHYQ